MTVVGSTLSLSEDHTKTGSPWEIHGVFVKMDLQRDGKYVQMSLKEDSFIYLDSFTDWTGNESTSGSNEGRTRLTKAKKPHNLSLS